MADIQTAVLLGAIGTLFGLLIKSQRDLIRVYKSKYKGAVRGRRVIRMDSERQRFGTPTVPPPPLRTGDEYDDDSQVIDAMDREDILYQADADRRLRGVPRGLPLEGVGKKRLPQGAGREDYIDHELDRQSRGLDTPTHFRPRMPTHREDEATAPGGFDEPDAGMRSPPGSLFPPPRPERKRR